MCCNIIKNNFENKIDNPNIQHILQSNTMNNFRNKYNKFNNL
jgi:hypothetical protein